MPTNINYPKKAYYYLIIPCSLIRKFVPLLEYLAVLLLYD
jgi:hypothetical protein